MTRSLSAREANQRFSDMLGRAAQGEATIITRRGEPVAELVPYVAGRKSSLAWARLLGTLETGLSLGGESFDRDALYDR